MQSLLLLHGFLEDHQIWDGLRQSLPENYEVLSPDLPGFGGPHLDADLETWATWLEELRLQQGIENWHLLGHSMGGYLALAYAAIYEKRVSSLTLLHSTALADAPEKKLQRDKMIELLQQEGVEPVAKHLIPNLFNNPQHAAVATLVESTKVFDPALVSRAVAAMRDRPDQTAVLRGATFPVHLIAGKYDKLIDQKTLAEQAALPKVARFTVLKSSGHMGFAEEPAVCFESIRTFLTQH